MAAFVGHLHAAAALPVEHAEGRVQQRRMVGVIVGEGFPVGLEYHLLVAEQAQIAVAAGWSTDFAVIVRTISSLLNASVVKALAAER